MNKNGIITKGGKFIACDSWKHLPTAIRYNTESNFGYFRWNSFDITAGLVGELNHKILQTLMDYCIYYKLNLEDIADVDLQYALKEKG